MGKNKKPKIEKVKPDNSNVTPKMLVAGLRAKYGPEAAMLMGETGTGAKGVCPTGLAVLDRWVLGIGGLPYGRTVEIFGPESCLAADTHIQYAVVDDGGEKHNSKGGTIERLYERFNGVSLGGDGRGKYSRLASEGASFTAPCMNDEGRIFHNRIVDVVKTGAKECFELRTGTGEQIVATADHKFCIGEKFVRLGDLAVGDYVLIHNNTPFEKAEQDRMSPPSGERVYLYVAHHPVAGVKVVRSVKNRTTGEMEEYRYHRVARSRAVIEARMNCLTLGEFVVKLNAGEAAVVGLNFLRREDHVHHEDEDHSNDDPANLVVISASEHGRLHALDRHNNLRFAAIPDEVVGIQRVGFRSTYDVKMASPFNNFVAGRFVVHNSGKTTLADKILAGVQRDGGTAALIETEQSFDPGWAKLHGVDVDNLILSQPNYLDGDGGVLQYIESLVSRSSKARPIAVVLDSVAATPTKREFDEGITGDVAVAESARAWSTGLRTLNQVVARHNALLVLVNQTREKIGVMFGNPITTPGGNAIKFYASIRLSCFPGKKVEGYDGRHFYVTAVKNKLCPPYRKAIMRMSYTAGFDEMWNIINYAKDVGCLGKSEKVSGKALAEACKNLGWPEPVIVGQAPADDAMDVTELDEAEAE